MSVVTRCGAVSLVVGLLVGVTPVRAQTAPAETSGSSWTDPPVRGSASPEAPGPVKPAGDKPAAQAPVAAETAAPAGAAKADQRAVVPPTTPAQKAASALGVKPVEANQRLASAAQARRSVVRPRMVERPLVLTRRPARIVERPARRFAQRPSRRLVRSYAFAADSRTYDRVDPYDGRSHASTWTSRRLAGWDGLVEESRASRIARAREAGYAVMNLRTYERPDGSRIGQLTPFGGVGLDDLD